MRRFFLPPDQCSNATIYLTGGEAHHALRVLRVRKGEQVTVLDGAGAELLCVIQQVGRDNVQLSVSHKRSVAPLPYQITLLQALPKGKLIESIIQKATELGVYRIVPLLSERTTLQRLGEKAEQTKTEKWRLVAVEAIKQCGSAWLPKIEPLLTPKEFLRRTEPFELPLIASLQSDSRHAREYFQSFYVKRGRKPDSLCVWVGPEGDFTPSEIDMIKASRASPISLGPLVLRTETAAIYCLSILNYEMQA